MVSSIPPQLEAVRWTKGADVPEQDQWSGDETRDLDACDVCGQTHKDATETCVYVRHCYQCDDDAPQANGLCKECHYQLNEWPKPRGKHGEL